MPFRWNPREHVGLAAYALKWLMITVPAGAVIGSAVALFLWSLDWVTRTRWDYPWLLYLLPVAGIAVGTMYTLLGKSVEAGNNLIIEQIHHPGGGIPRRMTPLVLIGTLITHLFGGSAGREGTAVQMGGSIASAIGRWFRLNPKDTRTLLMAGVAAGFGAVFGTPLAGAIFALEVLAIGRMSYDAIIPCLMASIIGDSVTAAWGVHHTRYHIGMVDGMNVISLTGGISWALVGKAAIAGMIFGLASVLFVEIAHGTARIFKRICPWSILRPAVGGAVVIALVWLLGTRDYLGLGASADPHHPNAVTILSAFNENGATNWSWWWKILFTAVTLGSGFKGGEVTPLFFIGATLGNVLARWMNAPVDLFAGLGFVAIFAGATNTPLACTIMGIELFAASAGGVQGSGLVVYLAVACFMAYLMSGHTGVYMSQRIGMPKLSDDLLADDVSLQTAHERKRRLFARWWREI